MTAAGAPASRLRPPDDGLRSLVTPEGVDLRLKVATYGERCGAFIIDSLIILAALIVLTIGAIAVLAGAGSIGGGQIAAVIWMLGYFALRNFYFMAFELRPGAATPGKRLMRLRVIARNGGRLTADAVFARNAMRELEVFLPAFFLVARGGGVDAALILLGVVWSGVFLLFPLFNRDRLRLGDLAAGTMVVKAPRQRLIADLADGPATVAGVAFTQAQLDAYGVKELHVLEKVLRSADRRAVAEVARRIRAKIGWTGDLEVSDRAFLGAYYAALRGRLEGRLLFGHRRRDKFDKA